MALAVSTRPTGSRADRRRFVALVAVLVGTLVVLAWTVSYPGVPFSGVGLTLLGGSVSLVLAVLLLGRRDRVHPVLVVGAGTLAVALAVAVVVSGAPRTVRFEVSRPALERVVAGRAVPSAADVPDHATFAAFPGPCPVWIGAYDVVDCRAIEGGYLFLQRANAVTDDSGIAWLPGGPSAARPDGSGLGPDGFTHLDGPWYRWTCGC